MEFIIKERCLKMCMAHTVLDFTIELLFEKNIFFSKEPVKYIVLAHTHTHRYTHTHAYRHR